MFPTSAARSSWRSAIADTVAAVSATKRSSICSSSASSRVSSVALKRNGAKYLVLSAASAAFPSYQVPEPRITLRSPVARVARRAC